MLKLFLSVLPLALAAAWSPTRLSVSVYNLSSRQSPFKRGVFFFIGSAIACVLISMAILLIVNDLGTGIRFQRAEHNALVASLINLILGFCFVNCKSFK